MVVLPTPKPPGDDDLQCDRGRLAAVDSGYGRSPRVTRRIVSGSWALGDIHQVDVEDGRPP